ncbi:DUF6850 family outer membrane beta-barrel protein [Rufibacter immobilis]|uniref:DUF6850 family outer membrane beta-barrel protein n=1 Tax=Rufibacter immobilis TaxID=1348778 RepID=UPI0035F0A017
MRILFTVFSLFLPMWGHAQQNDSLHDQSAGAAFQTVGLYHQRLYSLYEQVPGQVLFHPSAGYSHSTLEFMRASGSWRTPQLPERNTQYKIASRGVTQVNKFKLWGDFQYRRNLEDSIGWRLKPDQADISPYYLANIRPGNWDNHEYQLKGTGGVPLTRRLSLVAGAQLETGTYGRSNDPRADITRYRLTVDGGLGYRIGPVTAVLSGRYGYGEEVASVSYQNIMNQSDGRPEYTTQDVMGYGYYRIVSSKRNLYEFRNLKGGSLVLQAGQFNVGYSYQLVDRRYRRKIDATGDISPYSPIGEVTQKEHRVVSNYTWAGDVVQRLCGGELRYTHVKDFNQLIIQGNNYLGIAKEAVFTYNEKRPAWEFGLKGSYQSVSKKDGTASVDYLVQTLTLSGQAAKELPWGKDFVRLKAQLGYRTDLNSHLTIGSQYNAFMTGVILPDFTYYSSEQVEAGLQAGYGVKVKQVMLMPAVHYTWQQALSPQSLPQTAFAPGNNYQIWALQLNIYL